jgi:sulfatase maturation enzyme AslB (radical SAM superfamily)
MPAKIQDEFANRNDLSRARKYQLRHIRLGLCQVCPAKAVVNSYCLKHWTVQREKQRKRKGNLRRNLRAKSYRMAIRRRQPRGIKLPAAKIQDEFTNRSDISKARKYQLRHIRLGLCQVCPAKAVVNSYCLKHWIVHRERQRKKRRNVRRNLHAKSYRMENE